MRRLSDERHKHLVTLRMSGKSIPEISKETGVAKTTVLRHIKGVQVPHKFQTILRVNITAETEKLVGSISNRDYLFLLVGLYWGEGTKMDFSVINSDPLLIQTFIHCLKTLNIANDRLAISLRVHRGISIPEANRFWARTTGLPKQIIERVEIIDGKKKGKLPHGMCRVRVRSGIRDRLLIQSAIDFIGKE